MQDQPRMDRDKVKTSHGGTQMNTDKFWDRKRFGSQMMVTEKLRFEPRVTQMDTDKARDGERVKKHVQARKSPRNLGSQLSLSGTELPRLA